MARGVINSWNKWRLVATLVIFVAVFTLSLGSLADGLENFPVGPSLLQNEEPVLCAKFSVILSLDQNSSIVTSDGASSFNRLSLPSSEKEVQLLDWKEIDKAKFYERLPVEYNRLANYLSRESKGEIEKVDSISVDVYNRGFKNELYRVFYRNGESTYISEPDPTRKGFKRIFEDNAAYAEPFIYKDRVLFIDKRGKKILILQYRSQGDGVIPVKILCEYE